jgi:signal transduction histidine kinase
MHCLVVADASPGRQMIVRELRERGHDVWLAEDVDRAWHLWSEHRHPLAVVADRVNGACTIDFCRLLRRPPVDRLTLTLLIVPARRDARELQQFIEAGVDDWLIEDADPRHTALRLTLAERRVARIAERQHVREELGRAFASMEKERTDLDAHVKRIQKFESLGVLAGSIAHDFNNLVAGIVGQVSLILSQLPPEIPLHEPIHEIEAAATRAAELTRQLLDYAGRASLVRERVHLSLVVADLESLLASAVGSNVSIHLALSENLPPVVATVCDLQQVLMNLVTNAAQAIGEAPGQVNVTTKVVHADRDVLARGAGAGQLSAGDYVSLTVEDNGGRMDDSARQHIFDPLFSTDFPGRGLGLAAVLGIVRAHGGTIVVESEAAGTTVRVLLPVAASPGEGGVSS